MVKFSEDIVKKLCAERESGISITDCADLCGVSRKTLYNWIDKGKNARSGKYRDFYERFEKANADFKKSLVDDIKKDKTWQSSAWLLERTFPEQYGKKDKLDMRANVKSKNDLSVYFSDEQIAEALRDEDDDSE